MPPKITVLLCTARGDHGYHDHKEWHTIGKVVDDLSRQTFKDFELVVVDGLYRVRDHAKYHGPRGDFEMRVVSPRQGSYWVQNKHVAICAYRNAGIAAASGELIVNLDDACELPSNYLETFWYAYEKHNVCISPVWKQSGDSRPEGICQSVLHDGEQRPVPGIYGFGCYPRERALTLNGYDEAFDGGQGLEDADWSVRLHQVGVRLGLVEIPGFIIHAQTGHDPRAVRDDGNAIVKCCNRAWFVRRVKYDVAKPNQGYTNEQLNDLYLGPCPLVGPDNACMHHGGAVTCAYADKGLHKGAHELAVNWDAEGFNLRKESEKCRS